MKRIISVLFVLCFSISCFAQISRTFWGLTLGTSTKQQVKNVLVQKGYKITTEPDGSYSVNPDNVSFGGGYWTYVSFGFVNGKLSTVWFQNNERQCPLALNDLYDKLKNSLDKKYSNYYYDLPLDNTSQNAVYDDGRTSILLGVRNYNYMRYISISYEDNSLSKKKIQNAEDEL